MPDLFNDYRLHRQKVRKNVSVVAASLMLAVLANVAIFKSDIGASLRTSVQDYSSANVSVSGPDVRLEVTSTGADMFAVKIGRPIVAASQVRFTLLADPASVSLDNFFTENKRANIVKQSNIPGVYGVTVEFDAPTDLAADEILLFVGYNRKSQEGATAVNMAEAQFTASGTSYQLSNRGTQL